MCTTRGAGPAIGRLNATIILHLTLTSANLFTFEHTLEHRSMHRSINVLVLVSSNQVIILSYSTFAPHPIQLSVAGQVTGGHTIYSLKGSTFDSGIKSG